MKTTPVAVSLVLLATFAARSPAASPSALAIAMRDLERATQHGTPEELQQSRAAFAAVVADDPGSARAQYGLALADWRIVPMLGPDARDLGRRLCREGVAACDRALAAEPKFAEALALKAGIQGLSLGYVPAAAMALGPEIAENGASARGMQPDNPRVALLVGINMLHTPAFAGGGPARARPLLERAVALFEGAAGDTSDMAWGRVDAYIWSGRCRAAMADWAGARERYRQALAIAPEHAWVKRSLLPEAEQHLAGTKDAR